jgi:hypothetical protein
MAKLLKVEPYFCNDQPTDGQKLATWDGQPSKEQAEQYECNQWATGASSPQRGYPHWDEGASRSPDWTGIGWGLLTVAVLVVTIWIIVAVAGHLVPPDLWAKFK